MRRLAIVVALASTLVVPAAAQAGGWATVTLAPPPAGLEAGETWTARLTVLRHGVTPTDGAAPSITIRSKSGSQTFQAKPAGATGKYVAHVVFPTAGAWRYEVSDGLTATGYGVSQTHTYAAVDIAPATGGGGGGLPAWPFARHAAEDAMPEVWLVGADGSDAHRLVEGGLAPSWAPDGSRIAFEGLGGVATVKPDGTDIRALASGGEPAWSPDGRRIVLSRAGDIWLMRQDGSGQRRLTRTSAQELEPSFSPDGRLIVFSSDRTGNKDVFTMRTDGSGVRNLTRHPAEDWATSWQPLR